MIQTRVSAARPMSRKSLKGAESSELQRRFPPRPRPDVWPETTAPRDEVLDRLQRPPLWAATAGRPRLAGARLLLPWLESLPGETWQDRWLSAVTTASTKDELFQSVMRWNDRTATGDRRSKFNSGLLALICADVFRPDLQWMIQNPSGFLRTGIKTARDPQGFARIEGFVKSEVLRARHGTEALTAIAQIIAAYGGRVEDITVGEFLLRMELVDPRLTRGTRLAYTWLRDMGQFPSDAPPTLRNINTRAGQVTPERLVDRYGIKNGPMRDLLISYLTERQPALDYNTLKGLSTILAGNFWADLEHHHPELDSLRLPQDIAAAWKERIATKTVRRRQADGTIADVVVSRHSAPSIKATVRAFYLDIAQWALEEPERWGPWAVPCPISDADCSTKKNGLRQKTQADQRTRERLPVLPALVRVATQRLKDARARLEALRAAPMGSTFTILGDTFTVPAGTDRAGGQAARVADQNGKLRYLVAEERGAFFAWATIEILRHTGIRIEELLELGHHSIISYALPSTGQVVPLLQIAPSKTDQERLLLVTPELADVLSAVVSRVRGSDGRVPQVVSYDPHERIWNEPLPLLFQYETTDDNRRFAENFIRRVLQDTLEASGLTDAAGAPLRFQPHDFRRIFITDAILNGLPPHIAQVIAGHTSIKTTMGYAAIYPSDAIEAHRAFIARRRSLRPAEEYRAVTPEEWDEFLGHFERRKLALGECGRAYGTDCVHEHACIRCPVLVVDFSDMPRMVEIRDNLLDRIAEAEREGWLGEVEGLSVSVSAAEEKIARLEARQAQKASPIFLGVPSFDRIVARTNTSDRPDAPNSMEAEAS
ncbi:tyrosine-type recombinase/integrase [Streptomyces sp. NPDC015139]|uniref:tyrosine-type recombinase/integrase n=1 Tax=Streptomyces sp. NPDC015139 TaxID=3364942 RepID=UPI0036F8C44F